MIFRFLFLVLVAVVPFTLAAKITHQDALRQIQSAGISISSSGNCSDRKKGNCTSLDDIHDSTIKALVAFKRQLPADCQVVVTGGTEVGHTRGTYSHENGYKIDIRRNPCVTNYITKNFPYAGMVGAYKTYKNSAGHIFMDENGKQPHWDITVR